jgi:ABC-type Na+ transport system ATPase subunit NatA
VHEDTGMIEAVGLSKRYGQKVAVDDVSFTVKPGMVTGFLGPRHMASAARASPRSSR